MVSFRDLFLYVSFSFLSRLDKSSEFVLFCLFVCLFVLYLISKLIKKRNDSCFIFVYRFSFHA